MKFESLLALLCLQRTNTATVTQARATTVTVAKNNMAATTAATASLLMTVTSNWFPRPTVGKAVGSEKTEVLLVMDETVLVCGNAVGCRMGVRVAAVTWGSWIILVVAWGSWIVLVVAWGFWMVLVVAWGSWIVLVVEGLG